MGKAVLLLCIVAVIAAPRGAAAGRRHLGWSYGTEVLPERGYEIDLPIGSIARGEYVIAIEASHGADQAKSLVSFRVGSPQQ